MDYQAKTYCGLDSDTWSQDFSEANNLTKKNKECTCKKCRKAYKKIQKGVLK